MDQQIRVHPESGRALKRDVRPFGIDYLGRRRTIDLPGWYPEDPKYNDDAILDSSDAKILDRAFNQLKAEAEGLPTSRDVRRIRRRLGLSQRSASDILGGGLHAFQKYESGDVIVSRPMANLLRLLDQNPSLLKTLIADRAA